MWACFQCLNLLGIANLSPSPSCKTRTEGRMRARFLVQLNPGLKSKFAPAPSFCVYFFSNCLVTCYCHDLIGVKVCEHAVTITSIPCYVIGRGVCIHLISGWLSKNCDKNSRMRKISYSKFPPKVHACADSCRNFWQKKLKYSLSDTHFK